MSLRDVDSALASNFSLYSSHTVSRGKDFVELCDDDLPSSLPKTASGKSEDLVNPPVSLRSVNFNLPPLHEAAERGDSKAVSRLLADKNVDVNEKAGGHRAQRTALHRAAGYGHLSVVQLLIEAGADPMKCSSVHRTSLHEACTGGHSNVVKYLLQHVTDLDLADLNGQTAAHLAAFHGEADCLRSLESKGSNITLEDKLGRSPAHLAAMKNHPSVLRCILQSNVEINSVDDQGRTPAHYAAIAGGLESLKVLAYNDIDVNSRDVSGCVPAHYAAAHDHSSCLEFLLGSGLTRMDVRDKTGRSLLHLAAQHGAKECVHWLLQKRASPNIRDGSGATPSHLAALGAHLQSLSCLIKHGADLDSQTGRGELPIDFAKRTGNPNSFLKAVSGEVPCKFCVSRQQRIDYDLTHQPTPVEKHIIKQESEIFVTPKEPEDSAPKMPHVRSSRSAAKTVKSSSTKNPNLPKRDLATKYFGEHLYSLPVGVIGQETVVRSDKSRRKR